MNEQKRRLRRHRSPELEVTTAAIVAVDDVAEIAMRKYRWERRGWLGRLVRTQNADSGLAEQRAKKPEEAL